MRLFTILLAAPAAFLALPALAQDGLPIVGMPELGAMGFQPAGTDLAVDQQWLDWLLLVIITAITLLVMALVVYAMVRFRRRANPNSAQFTHNSPLEVAWTVVPIVILVFIGAFSLPVLFKQQEIPEGEINIKVTGYQWYWGYEYVDHDFAFDSFMIGQPATGGNYQKTPEAIEMLEEAGYSEDAWLLATDTAMVVPIGKTVVVTVTGADVIHSWTVPAFGVKQDAVPGRLAQLWFTPEREGIYFGQCSELCGKDHAYMPITVKVVSQEVYDEWLETAIDEYAGTPRSFDVASAE